MSSRRALRAASAIREVVSMAILREMKDPRVQNVTVTYVEVAPDMRTAKIHVSIMGSKSQQDLALHGLRSAAGYLQSRVADRVETRYVPKLEFEIDRGVKNALEVARILDEELGPGRATADRDSATDEGQGYIPRESTTGILEPDSPAHADRHSRQDEDAEQDDRDPA